MDGGVTCELEIRVGSLSIKRSGCDYSLHLRIKREARGMKSRGKKLYMSRTRVGIILMDVNRIYM